MAYEFEKYACTKETLKETLDMYGVAVIPNVLDTEECQAKWSTDFGTSLNTLRNSGSASTTQ
jgi:hypothetical protein